jgi:hypothetical protein
LNEPRHVLVYANDMSLHGININAIKKTQNIYETPISGFEYK